LAKKGKKDRKKEKGWDIYQVVWRIFSGRLRALEQHTQKSWAKLSDVGLA
jgi:hypothetical protein